MQLKLGDSVPLTLEKTVTTTTITGARELPPTVVDDLAIPLADRLWYRSCESVSVQKESKIRSQVFWNGTSEQVMR